MHKRPVFLNLWLKPFFLETTLCVLTDNSCTEPLDDYTKKKEKMQKAFWSETRETVYKTFPKLGRELKHDAQRSISYKLQGVWKCGKAMSLVFDISSQSKLKLWRKGKTTCKIIA